MDAIAAINDEIVVDGGLLTISPKSGWLSRRRSKLDEPVTWPADRTTVTFARTDGSGQWRATFEYEGRSVVVALAPAVLDDLVSFATGHLGGTTNSIGEAEADRERRRRLD